MFKSWVKPVVGLAAVLGLGFAASSPIAFAQESDELDLDDLFSSESAAPADSSSQSSSSGAPDESADDESTVPVVTLPKEHLPAVSSETESADAAKAAHKKRAVMLEEIVVTARKREESLQDIPLSVTPFTASELEQRGFVGLDDIAAATPGFTFEGFMTGGAHGNAVIRGLSQQFTTARIQNVSFFLDGVYLQRQSMLNLGLVDMERIEVVKGPQNALYGRNAFAGAINYITLRPGAQPEGYLSLGMGDNQRREYRVSFSGPMGDSQTLFGKFTAGTTTYDGHTKNNHPMANANPAGPNLRGNLGGWDDATYSASLAYEPSENWRVRGSYYRSEAEREAAPGYSISGVRAARFGFRFDDQNDLNCNMATVADIQPYPPRTHTGYSAWCGELPLYASDVAERRVDGIVVDPRAIGTVATTNAVTFTADYDITPEMSLHYLYGYADHESYTDGGASDEDPVAGRGININAIITQVDNQQPAAYAFANTASSRPNSELESFSHELRMDWEFTDRLRTSFGAYYSVVEDQEWTAVFINDLCNADTQENIDNCNQPLSAPNTLAERTVMTSGVAYDLYARQHGGKVRGEWTGFKDTISSIFGSLSYEFTERLNGTLEARISQEAKEVQRFTDFNALAPGESVTYLPPDPVLPIPPSNSVTSAIFKPFDSETFIDFTPRAILNWAFADESMVYLSVAKGVKSGGFNNALDESELVYDEEVNWTYELGSKNSFFHRTITLNGAIFLIDQSTLQGGVPPSAEGVSASDIVTNIGGAESVGIEIESNILLPFGFSADLGLTYNDAQYTDGTIYSGAFGSFLCDDVTCPSSGEVGGNQMARSSKEQFSLGVNYMTDVRGWLMTSRIDTNYQSKQFVTPLNLAWAPARLITNASVRATSPDDAWELGMWVKNLTNEDYVSNAFYIGVFNQYMPGKGTPRTFGSTLKYNF